MLNRKVQTFRERRLCSIFILSWFISMEVNRLVWWWILFLRDFCFNSSLTLLFLQLCNCGTCRKVLDRRKLGALWKFCWSGGIGPWALSRCASFSNEFVTRRPLLNCILLRDGTDGGRAVQSLSKSKFVDYHE